MALRKHQRNKVPQAGSVPASIIICSRNNGQHLAKNLPSILEQQHPDFEVIVVNHSSTDDTEYILERLAIKNQHLKTATCRYDRDGKKPALAVGIAMASHDFIVVTDADCHPSSNQWLSKLSSFSGEGKSIVLGGAPLTHQGSVASVFASVDAAMVFCSYATAALRDQIYMGVGRNMAYPKTLYHKQNKRAYERFMAGDDDLLVSGARSSPTVRLAYDRDCLMYSAAPGDWRSFLRQKRRHVSVSWAYKFKDQIRLAMFATTHWLSLLMPALYIIFKGSPLVAIILLLVRWSVVWLVLKSLAGRFIQNISFILFVLIDYMFVIYYPIIVLFLGSKSPTKW